MSPEMMKGVFPFNEKTTYITRNKRKFHLRAIKSVTFGFEKLSHPAAEMWELIPVEIKNVESVVCFKKAIKKRENNELSLSSMLDVRILDRFSQFVCWLLRHIPVLPF